MKRAALLIAVAAACVAVAPAYAKKDAGPPSVAFLVPSDGPDASAAAEVLFGMRPAIAARLPGSEAEPDAYALTTADLPADDDLKSAFAKLKKSGTRLLVAYAPHGRTAPLPPLSAADSQAVATSLTQWQLEHPDEAAQHGLPAPARGRRSAR